MRRLLYLLAAVLLATLCLAQAPDDRDELKVGVQSDGRIIVPTNQVLKPAGTQITFPGRPVDLAFADDGKTIVVKNMKGLVFLDTATGKVKQTLALPAAKDGKNAGFSVVGLVIDGDRILSGDAGSMIRIAEPKDGKYIWADEVITLPKPSVGGAAHPAGIAKQSKGEVWVTATRGNNVHLVDPNSGKVLQSVAVGVAPFGVCVAGPDRVYVTNWGGDHPKDSDPTAKTSGTPVRVDPRTSVANHGSVSVLVREDGKWKQAKSVEVGLHPGGMVLSPKGRFLYVANAASDTVSVIDTRTDTVVETINCRPELRLPFGSGPNALALSPDGATLYVANGTNNCVAVVRLGTKAVENAAADRPVASKVAGQVPTGWFPGAILVAPDGKKLFVANIKGHGSLERGKREEAKGRNSHDHLGSVSILDVPDDAQLAKYTKEVNDNNRLEYSLSGLEKPRAEAKPVPVPARHGEPSVFEHVFYIIKENRTYDQVFGDMKEGNGDPNLVMFGEEVTPNHHKLAREFVLFDNFYCSGVLSADGHTWANEAIVLDYLERSFGGFTRSYPYEGSDPLAFSSTGFLWDNALARKKTFRNYGEYVKHEYEPKKVTWTDLYNDWKDGTKKVKIKATANLKSLEPYTHPEYPCFPLTTPDVYRAKLFLDEFAEFEKSGKLPNLIYMSLPCDHTNGTRPNNPTPRAMVADNDLALGQIVEAITKSKFWPKTCIFVVEDDPQNGFDHVDGHRTVALVISPYTKRKHVDHTNYNQTGMVKTIELLLGLPPMTQLDLSATPMRNCFTDKPDLSPYVCEKNRIKLDEMNKALSELRGKELYWAKKSLEQNLDDLDEADEDTFNRILWHATRGYDTPYPERFIGSRVADD